MWEITEGVAKFLHAMKIVPPKDLGRHCSSQHYHMKVSALGIKIPVVDTIH